MEILKKFIPIVLLPFLMAGCAIESPFENLSKKGEGKIKLSLTSSSEVKAAIPQFRSGSTEIVTPPVSLFQVRLSKTDGSYAKTWANIDEFAKETEFSVGEYYLEAFYGTPDSQGYIKPSDKGYEHAYYYGITENIIVSEDKETPVQINTSLGNSLIWIEYTDAFKNFFNSWNTILKTSGKENVEIGSEEGKIFVSPGKVDIIMDAILENGNPVFLNPAEFDAEPQHMYKITYDIFSGDNGSAILSLKFNDDPEATHDINVELNDEIVTGDVPVVSLVGYETSQIIETQTGTPFNNDVKFEVIAKGGITKAILKISSDTYSSSFLDNGQIDLCSATADQQQDMVNAGIKARGFFNNPDKMGFLDLNDFCKQLPAGTHEISLFVTDNNTNTNDPETPTVKIISVNTNSAITYTESIFGNGYADITVEYDGPDPTQNGINPFSFKLVGPRTGLDYPVEIKAIGTETNPLTRATYQSHTYTYRVSLPEEASDSYQIKMYFNESSEPVDNSHTVDITYPDYDVEYDSFANWMRFRVVGLENDENKKKLYIQRLRVFVDENEIKDVTKDIQSGIISFGGLTPNTSYKLKTTLQVSSDPDKFSDNTTIQTEEEEEVPNGGFEDLTEKYKKDNLKQSGTYSTSKYDAINYQNYSIFTVNEADNWATTNAKTMSGSVENTWFYQPSVFNSSMQYESRCDFAKQTKKPQSFNNYPAHSGTNAMVIRNVAWDPKGTVPEKCQKGTGNTLGVTTKKTDEYYNFTVPTISNVSVGKMFLGSYSYNSSGQSETYTEGKEFVSRPSQLTGWYIYKPDSQDPNDYGKATIKVMDKSNNIIASGTANLLPSDSYTLFKIDLSYVNFGEKAAKICIMVEASQYGSYNMAEETETKIKLTNYLSNYEAYKYGAVLVVDDFTFEY